MGCLARFSVCNRHSYIKTTPNQLKHPKDMINFLMTHGVTSTAGYPSVLDGAAPGDPNDSKSVLAGK